MNKRTLKQKKDSSKIEPNENCTTNNKALSFQDLCKENTRQQIYFLKLNKFVVIVLIVFKH